MTKPSSERTSLNQQLRLALMQGWFEQIELLISRGAEITIPPQTNKIEGSHEGTPLHTIAYHTPASDWAAERCIDALLAAGANVNETNHNGDTALHLASSRNHAVVVSKLLNAGADINAKSSYRMCGTPLHVAASCFATEAVALLLSANADPNSHDIRETTPLAYLTQNIKGIFYPCRIHDDNIQKAADNILKMLLDAGADVTKKCGPDGSTALHYLVRYGDSSALESYLARNLLLEMRNTKQATPLQVATYEMISYFGGARGVERLITAGAVIHDASDPGWVFRSVPYDKSPGPNVLHIAVLRNDMAMVKIILASAKVDVNVVPYEGSVLHWAACLNRVEIIPLLLAAGAKVDCFLSPGNKFTPIHTACLHGALETLKILLQHVGKGPLEKLYSDGGLPLLSIAAKYNHLAIAQCLVENGEIVTPGIICKAISANTSVELFRFLLTHFNNNWSAKLSNGVDFGPLNTAPNVELLRTLIEAGAPINSGYKDIKETPLMSQISRSKNLATARCLLNAGAQLDLPDAKSNLPIHYAASSGNIQGIDLLLEYEDASINATGAGGLTPLALAAKYLNIPMYLHLVQRGADEQLKIGDKMPEEYGSSLFRAALSFRRSNPDVLVREQAYFCNISTDTKEFSLFSKWQASNNELQNPAYLDIVDSAMADVYICPITQEIMFEPVVAKDGFTYEREAIEDHLSRNHTSPITNEPLVDASLVSNNCLRSMIQAFLETNPSFWRDVYIPDILKSNLLVCIKMPDCVVDEFKRILQKAPPLLSASLDDSNANLLVHLCAQGSKALQAYLPVVLSLLKPQHWAELIKSKSPQYWLKHVVAACGDNLEMAQAFFTKLQEGLDITITPQNLASYAISENHLALLKLSLYILSNSNNEACKIFQQFFEEENGSELLSVLKMLKNSSESHTPDPTLDNLAPILRRTDILSILKNLEKIEGSRSSKTQAAIEKIGYLKPTSYIKDPPEKKSTVDIQPRLFNHQLNEDNKPNLTETIPNLFTFWEKQQHEDISRNLTDDGQKHEIQERLNQQALHYGFQCRNVPADGNCFFSAVYQQLPDDIQCSYGSFQGLRNTVVNHVIEHFNSYCDYIGDNDFDSFVEKLRKNGEWVDQIAIQAASRVLNQTIVIVRSDGANPTVIRQQNADNTLYLGYQVGLHYLYLVHDSDNPIIPDRNLQEVIDAADCDTNNPLVRSEGLLDTFLHC